METQLIEKQFCPICNAEVQKFERYPNYVCQTCSKKIQTEDGRPLEFFNESLSGGIIGRYADTKEKYESVICYIDETKCLADEARFGGIVIQTIKPDKIDRIKD